MKKIKSSLTDFTRYIQFEIIEINPNATDKLAGKIFVVSGVFQQFSRDELKKSKLKIMEGK
jgi:NAD-dependent DNA ligase